MYFEQISTPGLGCFSYAVGCPLAGVMAVVDPRRDVDVYLGLAEKHRMRITHIFETHVHADHVSGAQELRAATKGDIYLHESAPVSYPAKKLKNGDSFQLGAAAFRVLHTPGHTPNSVSLLISDLERAPEPELILTGDLLFVGDIGRPDLPGAEILEEQVKNLYNSLYKTLAQLPGHLKVYPAHGQGSLCGRAMSALPSSSLGYERQTNPMLKYPDFPAFKKAVLANLPMRPQSFSSIIAANLRGAALLPEEDPAASALSAAKTAALLQAGSLPLDLREARDYSAAHIPGSINVDCRNSAALNWIGMVTPPGAALVLILPPDQSFAEMRTALSRIGYDKISGWLKGGLPAWQNSGHPTQTLPHLSTADLQGRLTGPNPPALIDVRSPEEFQTGKIDGSINLTFSRILEQRGCPVAAEREKVIICQSGFRAGIAASLLQSQGCSNIGVLTGGMLAWQRG